MTRSGVQPTDAEMIAAFLDRRLGDDERRTFLERLDREGALYEVFVETVRYRDQAAAKPAGVVEHPAGRRRWALLAAVAALVALAVATPFVLRTLSQPGYAGALVADGKLDPYLGGGWYEQGWSETRGISPGTDEADTAFRIGVRIVDLEVALRLGRADDATRLTHRLERLLGRFELSELLQLSYGEVRRLLEEEAAAKEALALAETTESSVREFFPELDHAYELGKWAEAGKLAARSENAKLLRSRAFRQILRDLEREEWTAEVATDLATITELLEPPEPRLDLPRLEEAFAALISRS